jgi:hypothetical protein
MASSFAIASEDRDGNWTTYYQHLISDNSGDLLQTKEHFTLILENEIPFSTCPDHSLHVIHVEYRIKNFLQQH